MAHEHIDINISYIHLENTPFDENNWWDAYYCYSYDDDDANSNKQQKASATTEKTVLNKEKMLVSRRRERLSIIDKRRLHYDKRFKSTRERQKYIVAFNKMLCYE